LLQSPGEQSTGDQQEQLQKSREKDLWGCSSGEGATTTGELTALILQFSRSVLPLRLLHFDPQRQRKLEENVGGENAESTNRRGGEGERG